jgi:hypothetical protein
MIKFPSASDETEKDITEAILKITMTIKENFPELSKYIEEMPVTIPNAVHPHINTKILKDYYDSLYELLRKYMMEHPVPVEVK